jgi:hypothetical protein
VLEVVALQIAEMEGACHLFRRRSLPPSPHVAQRMNKPLTSTLL